MLFRSTKSKLSPTYPHFPGEVPALQTFWGCNWGQRKPGRARRRRRCGDFHLKSHQLYTKCVITTHRKPHATTSQEQVLFFSPINRTMSTTLNGVWPFLLESYVGKPPSKWLSIGATDIKRNGTRALMNCLAHGRQGRCSGKCTSQRIISRFPVCPAASSKAAD